MGRSSRFLPEARRRRVFRAAGLYVVGAWVLLQVAALALQSLEMPDSLLRYFWFAAFAGFPIVMIFSWYYEITSSGIRRTMPAASVADAELQMRVPDYVIIGAVAVIVAVGAAGFFDRARQAESLSGPYDPNGIAVLPLHNLSADEDQDYFSAGIQDALITNLSKISAMRVVSRTSTLELNRSLKMPAIGKVLGVRNIIEGSVTREGNRVRVIIQLIDAAEDAHIWAENFERDFTSVLSLQNEIARSIAKAIDVQLSAAEDKQLSVVELVDPEVYDRYLRATYLLNQSDNRVRRGGIEILEALVEDGKADARIYAALAYGYAVLGHSPFPEGMYPASLLAAQKALELDDSIADVYLALGMHQLYYEWNFKEAEKYLLQAIQLNPNLTGAVYHYSWLMELMQRSDKSLPFGDKTIQLDPLSARMRADLASQYRNAGRLEDGTRLADESLALAPDNDYALRIKAMLLLQSGDVEQALAVSSRISEKSPWRFAYGFVLASAGREQEARAELALVERSPRNVISLISLHAALGDTDEVFHWLRVARDAKLPWYPWFITWFPGMQQYWHDPRMRELAEEIGLGDVLLRSRQQAASYSRSAGSIGEDSIASKRAQRSSASAPPRST